MPAQTSESDLARPVGIIRPPHQRAIRALKALEEKRIKDAWTNTEGVPESPVTENAWRLLLRGLIFLEQPDFARAEAMLLQGVSAALVAGLGEGPEPDRDALRLAALSLEKIGGTYRRQDRPQSAYRAHLAAHHLRREYGSVEEVWESAVNLGIDADLARRHEDAERWHRTAIAAGAAATEEPHRKQAIAWANLAASFTSRGSHLQAVDAAGNAREHWHTHDVGNLESARSEMHLGHALLMLGESLHTEHEEQAKHTLDDAIHRLDAARESLLPFGAIAAADAQWCLDQGDFAGRLRAALEG